MKSLLFLVLAASLAALSSAATVEVGQQLNSRFILFTLPDTAKNLLAEVVTAQLQNKQPLVGKTDCSGALSIKIDATAYMLCGSSLVKNGQAFEVDDGLLLDIIYSDNRPEKLTPVTATDKTALAAVVERSKKAMAFRELYQYTPKQAFKSARAAATSTASLQPRFADEALGMMAKVSPAVYNGTNDPEFPGRIGRDRIDLTVVNQPNRPYNCYGYATNSRRWGAPGCYSASAAAKPTANLPNNWGDGWCKARAGSTSGIFTSQTDPCVALLAAHVADGLAANDPGNGIKVAVFSHMFMTAVNQGTGDASRGTFCNREHNMDFYCSMDYHYHRMDSNGQWSDKNGDDYVWPNQFADPVVEDATRCANGLTRMSTRLAAGLPSSVLYHTKFCGYKWATNRQLEALHYHTVANSLYC